MLLVVPEIQGIEGNGMLREKQVTIIKEIHIKVNKKIDQNNWCTQYAIKYWRY